ncbi:MAG: 2-oxoacid:acceptor oxidoreductase subunit alpha, partial [Bacteroidota bacterium]
AFPFDQTLEDFIAHHKRIFVIEQNRDAQMRTLLIAELDADPQKLIPLLNYDGMPITAARIIAGLKGEKIPVKV